MTAQVILLADAIKNYNEKRKEYTKFISQIQSGDSVTTVSVVRWLGAPHQTQLTGVAVPETVNNEFENFDLTILYTEDIVFILELETATGYAVKDIIDLKI
jgi:hypothetical protein